MTFDLQRRAGVIPTVNKRFRNAHMYVYTGARFEDGQYYGKFLTLEGEIDFPQDNTGDAEDRAYYTEMGPCFAHNFVFYKECDESLKLALRRQLGARGADFDLEKDDPGCEARLRLAQETTLMQGGFVAFRELLVTLHASALDFYEGWNLERLVRHNEPHKKKVLREACMRDIEFFGCDMAEKLTFGWPIRAKLKLLEFAKPGKLPRSIGDLGVFRSLFGVWITDLMKKPLAQGVHWGGGEMQYIPSPKVSLLEEVFLKIWEPEADFYMPFFSDDSCLGIRTRNGVLRGNMDIASCDTSHTSFLFDLMVEITPELYRSDMRRLVRQLEEPFRVYSTFNPKNFVELRPKGPRLLSGSTVTTLINNLANCLIGFAVARCKPETPEGVIAAAATVGYLVTFEVAEQPEDLQFLKHSPVQRGGRMIPLLNLGVLLRTLGRCKGDMPGRSKTPMCDRASTFAMAVTRGMYPRVSSPFLDYYKYQVGKYVDCKGLREVVDRIIDGKVASSEGEHFVLTHEELTRRYLFTADDDLYFTSVLPKVGEAVAGSPYNKVLVKDYGAIPFE